MLFQNVKREGCEPDLKFYLLQGIKPFCGTKTANECDGKPATSIMAVGRDEKDKPRKGRWGKTGGSWNAGTTMGKMIKLAESGSFLLAEYGYGEGQLKTRKVTHRERRSLEERVQINTYRSFRWDLCPKRLQAEEKVEKRTVALKHLERTIRGCHGLKRKHHNNGMRYETMKKLFICFDKLVEEGADQEPKSVSSWPGKEKTEWKGRNHISIACPHKAFYGNESEYLNDVTIIECTRRYIGYRHSARKLWWSDHVVVEEDPMEYYDEKIPSKKKLN